MRHCDQQSVRWALFGHRFVFLNARDFALILSILPTFEFPDSGSLAPGSMEAWIPGGARMPCLRAHCLGGIFRNMSVLRRGLLIYQVCRLRITLSTLVSFLSIVVY